MKGVLSGEWEDITKDTGLYEGGEQYRQRYERDMEHLKMMVVELVELVEVDSEAGEFSRYFERR